MFRFLNNKVSSELINSKLFSDQSFYPSFLKDIKSCLYELIIESPFISYKRVQLLMPVFKELTSRGVKIVLITKYPKECEDIYRQLDIDNLIRDLKNLGVKVIFVKDHHRKLAIIDRSILYEGSLNILSQNKSIEIMRRIKSTTLAWQMIKFTKPNRYFW